MYAHRALRAKCSVRGDRRAISDDEDASKDVEKTVPFPRPFSPKLVSQMPVRVNKCIVNTRTV